jgi:UDP-N-acetylmuramate dehydrogenase
MSTGIEQNVPIARYTTVGIGGPARGFARSESIGDLQHALAWAAERGLAVVPMGLGSNVLVPDEGVDALVLRLAGELALVHVDGELLLAGGGATNAVCLHQARAAGLGGFEFACAIPGTAGGGVRMNAGAYGREWKDVVERAVVVDTAGVRSLSQDELRLSYRHSAVEPGQVVASVEFRLEPNQPEAIKARIGELQRQRKATQPTNPAHQLGAGQMLEACGLKGYRIGGALISPRHANFIENAGDARAVDALGLMAEARRRGLETFGVVLEREVELLGGLELPPAGETL